MAANSGLFSRVAGGVLIALVMAYQMVLRPLLVGGTCKFHPSCSEYAIEAIRRHGPLGGGRLAMGRLMRCRPGTLGGLDPVP